MNTVSIEYTCKPCHYKTARKDCYDAHIRSNRHKKMANGYDKKYKYECDFCFKKYIHCASLSRHKRKCKIKKLKEKEIQNLKKEISKTDVLIAKDKEIEKLKKLLSEKDKIKDNMVKRMVEMAGKVGNNNISINLFLDNECKNAMPIMDFIKNLQFKLTDINPERPASTIESLSKCITDQLEDMDETERPVHCTDQKRLIFHVKDASGWSKDIDNKKIDKAIGWANARHQGAWIKKATDDNWLSKKHDTNYLNMNVAMGKFSDNPDSAKKKVKRAIAKATNWKETQKIFFQENEQ